MPSASHLRTASAWILFPASLLFLARVESRSDDEGIVVVLVLLLTFALGYLHPRRAWLWSLTGWSVPAADLLFRAPIPAALHIPGPLLLCAFMTAIGLAGCYSAVLLRTLTRARLAR